MFRLCSLLYSLDYVAVPCLCSVLHPLIECLVLQIGNEDAIADLICCGEVTKIKIKITISDNFEVQVLNSSVNFFLSDVHGSNVQEMR